MANSRGKYMHEQDGLHAPTVGRERCSAARCRNIGFAHGQMQPPNNLPVCLPLWVLLAHFSVLHAHNGLEGTTSQGRTQ